MLAARDGENGCGAGPHCPLERGIGRGVTGVEADDEIDAVEIGVGDVAEREAEPGRVEPSREGLALLDHLRLEVQPEQVDLAPVDAREQVVERKGQVRATRAEVDDPEPALRQDAHDVVDELDEAIDLPELRATRRAHAALGRLDAEGDEVRHGPAVRKQVFLGPVVRSSTAGACRRLPQDPGLAATAGEHLPVCLGLVEQSLAVVLPDRRRQQPREGAGVEVVVRRAGRVVAPHAPARTGAELDLVDGDATRHVRARRRAAGSGSHPSGSRRRAAARRALRRSFVIGVDETEDLPVRHPGPRRDRELPHDASAWGHDLVLHLHRLHHEEELARDDAIAVATATARTVPCIGLATAPFTEPSRPPRPRDRRRRASSAHGGSVTWRRMSYARPSTSTPTRRGTVDKAPSDVGGTLVA